MRGAIYPLLLLLAVAQAALIPFIRVFNGEPQLALLIVIACAALIERHEALRIAFVAAISADLLSAAPVGTSLAGMLVMVIGIDQLRRVVYRVGFPTYLLLVVIGTVVQMITVGALLAFHGYRVSLVQNAVYYLLPTLVYNGLASPVAYLLVRRLRRRDRLRG